MKPVRLGEKWIGPGNPTYVIAEAGVNHKGSLEAARRMIDEAARAGADAIKFQTYKADKLVTQTAPPFWRDADVTATQYAVYKRTDSFEDRDYQALYSHAQNVGITWLSTPFDLEAVCFLDELGVKAFKVASADLTNYPLLMAVAQTGKPVILATGASELVEINSAVSFLHRHGCHELVLLYSVLSYPTVYEDANLRRIQTLQTEFPDIPVGYSDHSIPDDCVTLASTAVALGAYVIKQYFTLDRSLPGDDHYLSADPALFARMVRNIRHVEQALGSRKLGVQSSEEAARTYARRSIVSARFIARGETITRSMLIMKRPGTGIPPTEVTALVGRVATVDIQPDAVISWDMVD